MTLMRVTAGEEDELAAVVAELRPDVLVIDDTLLRDGNPLPADDGLRVLVVGVDDNPAFAARAERLGAAAWIAKERADLLLSRPLQDHLIASGRRMPCHGGR